MRHQINYGDSSQILRLEMPVSWDAHGVTGVDIQITDDASTDLVASTAATLYTATTLAAAATPGDSTITLHAGAGDLYEGDKLRLEPNEDVEVLSYNTTSKVATLKHGLNVAHASGSEVSPLWATYDLDASDTDTWELLENIIIRWSPAGIDAGTHIEIGEVVKTGYGSSDFVAKFRVLYPALADMRESDLIAMEAIASEHIRIKLSIKDVDMDKVVPQDVEPIVLHYAAYLMCIPSEEMHAEGDKAFEESERMLEAYVNTVQWEDEDQDGAQDDSEFESHTPAFIERVF